MTDQRTAQEIADMCRMETLANQVWALRLEPTRIKWAVKP